MEEQNKTIEEKVVIELTSNELEVVFRGLLELPSKFSLTVIQGLQAQIVPQLQARVKHEGIKNDESTDTEGV